MGAQQSTRRLTVINDEASGVIKVCTIRVFTLKVNFFKNVMADCSELSSLFQSWTLVIIQQPNNSSAK